MKNAADLLGNDLKEAVASVDKGYESCVLAAHVLDVGGVLNILLREANKCTLPRMK